MDRLRDGTTRLTITSGAGEARADTGTGAGSSRTVAGADTRTGTDARTGGSGSGIGADPDTVVTVSLEVAASYRARTRGLLGRDGVEGALLLTPANSVHTFRMRFPIDVAYLTRDLRVIAVRTMRPGRLGLLRVRARHVLESEAGTMLSWGLRPGARLAIGRPDAGNGAAGTAGAAAEREP